MNVLLFIHNITTYCNRQCIELTHINVNYSIPASFTLEDILLCTETRNVHPWIMWYTWFRFMILNPLVNRFLNLL